MRTCLASKGGRPFLTASNLVDLDRSFGEALRTRESYESNARTQGFRGTVEAVLKPYQNGNIDWDEGREGYLSASARARKTPRKTSQGSLLSVPAEERIGCLIAAAGTIWATYAATIDFAGLWRMRIMPPGPVEICVLGILMWLHAKWRRSLRAN